MFNEDITLNKTEEEYSWILPTNSSDQKDVRDFKTESRRRTKEYEESPNSPMSFETRIWRLFHNMGAVYLNRDDPRNSSKFLTIGHNKNKKQVDVFAVIRDYAIIVSCTTSTRKNNINEKEDELKEYNETFSKRIDKIFTLKNGKKLKKLFIVAVKDWEIDQDDINLYTNSLVKFLPKHETEYLENIYTSSQNKVFTFNQFLGFLAKDVDSDEKVNVFALKTEVEGGTSYTFSLPAYEVIPSCVIAHRKAVGNYADRAASSTYYQRILKNNRLKSVSKFINERNSPFVDSILLGYRGNKEPKFDTSFSGKIDNTYSKNCGILSMPKSPGLFHVIDGQHRLFGFTAAKEELAKKLPLTFNLLVDLDIEEEATYFVDINQGSKSVDASLLKEIELVTKGETTETLATAISIDCREQENSPFKGLISDSENSSKNFKITSIIDGLKEENFFSQGNDARDSWKKGTLSMGSWGYSREVHGQLINKFFSDIKTKIPNQWQAGKNHPKNLAQQQLVIGLIKVLGRIIDRDGYIKIESEVSRRYTHIQEYVDFMIEKINEGLPDYVYRVNPLFLGKSGPRKWRSVIIEEIFKGSDFNDLFIKKVDEPLVNLVKSDMSADRREEQIKKELQDALDELALERKKRSALDKSDPFYENIASVSYETNIVTIFHHILNEFIGADYWDYLKINPSLTQLMTSVAKKETEMLKDTKSEESPTGILWDIKLSFCSLEDLITIYKSYNNIEHQNKEEFKSNIDKFLGIPHPDGKSGKGDNLYYCSLFNKLRRYGGAHKPVEGQESVNSKKDKEHFAYYSEELTKKISSYERYKKREIRD